MTEQLPVPEGYKLINRGGPFIAMLGPLYYKKQEQGCSIIALRIEDKHLNAFRKILYTGG